MEYALGQVVAWASLLDLFCGSISNGFNGDMKGNRLAGRLVITIYR